MLDAGVPLDPVADGGRREMGLQRVDHLSRPVPVGLGAGEVHLAGDPIGRPVRRVVAVRHQGHAVDRGGAADARAEPSCRREDERPAHAVANRADASHLRLRARIDEVEHRLGVA